MYTMRPSGRRIIPSRFALLAAGAVLLLLFGLAVPAPLHFFPFLWVLPLLAMRFMWTASARSRILTPGGQTAVSGGDRREKELLEALQRRGEITAALAALETSLSVAEADEMLSGLAENGHVRVHAREVRLAYSLWDMDRRGEIEGGNA